MKPDPRLPLVYACSGCSNAAQLANHFALRLTRAGLAEMSCIAGVGGQVPALLRMLIKRFRPLLLLLLLLLLGLAGIWQIARSAARELDNASNHMGKTLGRTTAQRQRNPGFGRYLGHWRGGRRGAGGQADKQGEREQTAGQGHTVFWC